MKKYFTLFILVPTAILSLSCTKDANDTSLPGIAAGTYHSQVDVKIDDYPAVRMEDDVRIVIRKVNNLYACVELRNFRLPGGIPMPLSVPSVPLVGTHDDIQIQRQRFSINVPPIEAGAQAVAVTARVWGVVTDKKNIDLHIELDIPPVSPTSADMRVIIDAAGAK